MIMYRNIPEIMTFRECCELLKIGKNTLLELLHTRSNLCLIMEVETMDHSVTIKEQINIIKI